MRRRVGKVEENYERMERVKRLADGFRGYCTGFVYFPEIIVLGFILRLALLCPVPVVSGRYLVR